jgi:hypothetical protein
VSILEAAIALEWANFNLGQALQDFLLDERLRALPRNELIQDKLNYSFELTPLQGGSSSNGSVTVQTSGGLAKYDSKARNPGFDPNNPTEVLRLNRDRRLWIERTIGHLPYPSKGRGERWNPIAQWEAAERFVRDFLTAQGAQPGWATMAADHSKLLEGVKLPGQILPYLKHQDSAFELSSTSDGSGSTRVI